MKNLILLLLLSVLLYGCQPSVLDDQALLDHARQADPARIEQHIAILAHDSLRGRLPGTPEYKIAMQYVVDQYEAMGIQPLGDNETYYQTMVLRNAKVDEKATYMLSNDDTLQIGEDYFFIGHATDPSTSFDGELVFAGYGIEAPPFGHNDFEDLDVEGKIVVVLNGGPDDLPATERAHFSSRNTKIQTLDQKGAVGILFTSPTGNIEGAYNYLSKRGVTHVLLPSGAAAGFSHVGAMKFGGYVDWEFIRGFTEDPDSIMARYKKGIIVQPNVRLRGQLVSNFSDFESSNVVGVLEGAELKNEYIVHTAHLDHVGVGEPIEGDSIYNGAHDNASGVSAMLEIARLYSTLPSKPRRSVIFAAVTAEEMGLLGSMYLAQNPVVPEEYIIANVNTDMPTMVGPLVSVEPLGAEQSSIMTIVERTTGLLNLTIDEDHIPEQVRFVRSDNYSFVLAGIPALRMKFGMKTTDPETSLDSATNYVLAEMYHKPADELGDSFNFDGAKTYVELQFMNSYLINATDARPAWNDDSFFRRFVR